MQIKIGNLPRRFEHLRQTRDDYIPTRFDDIQKEILLDRFKEYYAQKAPTGGLENSTFKLGDVIGNKLDKII